MVRWRDTQQAELRVIRRNTGAGQPQATRGSLAADVDRYLRAWTCDNAASRTQRARHLEYWVGVVGGRDRRSLTPIEIQEILERWRTTGLPLSARQVELREGGRRVRGTPLPLAYGTMKKIRQALYQVYAVLDRGLGLPNPVAAVPDYPTRYDDPRALPEGFVAEAVRHLPPAGLARPILLVLMLGVRPCELMRVQPGDFQAGEAALVIRTAKGGPKRRLCPLPPIVVQALEALEAAGRLGVPFEMAWVGRVWHRVHRDAAAALGIPPPPFRRPYDLRHTMATEVLAATGSVHTAQKILGHSSVSQTQRYSLAAGDPAIRAGLAAVAHTVPSPGPRLVRAPAK